MPDIQSSPMTNQAAMKVFNRRQFLSLNGSLRSEARQEAHPDEWIRVSRSAMACSFEAIIPAGDRGLLASQACFDEVDRLESILSVFRPASELNLLNRCAAADPVSVGPELFELLQACQSIHEETEGSFNVATGALSECWGFQHGKPHIPTAESLAAALKCVDFRRVSLGQDQTVSSCSPGLRINFGAVGKGYALDRGAAKMRACGTRTALLSAGYSSILAAGEGPDGAGWLVGLRHPVFKDQRMGTLRLHSCAIGTSGQEEQWFEIDGKRYGHILDPRTGFPPNGTLSVTVIADSATLADALATAFFVGGPELAKRYCDVHEGVVAVMLLENDLSQPIVIGSSDRAVLEFMHG